MRFLLVLIIFSTIAFHAVCGNFIYIQTPKDTINSNEPEVKTILIGNVSEASFGYFGFIPKSIMGDSINGFDNPRMRSWSFTQYFIINNYLVQTGLEFNTIESDYKIDFSNDSVTTTQVWINDTINTHYYIIDGERVPEHVIKQKLINRTDTLKNTVSKNEKNRIKIFTIPVNLGYRWRFDNFAIYAKAGARFNFVRSVSGQVYDAKNKDWLELDSETKKKFFLSGTASLAFEYPFSALGSVILETEYRYCWNKRTNTTLIKNYSQFGVKLGMQVWF